MMKTIQSIIARIAVGSLFRFIAFRPLLLSKVLTKCQICFKRDNAGTLGFVSAWLQHRMSFR